MTTEKTAATTGKASVKKLPMKKSPVPAKSITKALGKSGVKAAPQQAAKKPKKEHKKKVVRDSFTMPQSEYSKIAEIKAICPVSYTHLRAHETRHDLVCRLLLE